MNVEAVHCNYCNLDLNGQEQYTQHLAGKKHLKKMKTLGMTPPTKGPPNCSEDALSALPAAGYGGRFVSPASQNPAPKAPSVGTGQFDVILKTEKSTSMPVAKTVNHPVMHASVVTGTPQTTENSDPVMNAVKANLLGKLPLKRQAYEGRCDLCNVKYTSESHQDQHLTGSKHAKKLQLSQAAGENAATFFCGFCNVKVNSQQQMDQHRAGSIHMKRVENAKKTQNEAQPSAAKKQFVPSTDLQTHVLPPPPPPLA